MGSRQRRRSCGCVACEGLAEDGGDAANLRRALALSDHGALGHHALERLDLIRVAGRAHGEPAVGGEHRPALADRGLGHHALAAEGHDREFSVGDDRDSAFAAELGRDDLPSRGRKHECEETIGVCGCYHPHVFDSLSHSESSRQAYTTFLRFCQGYLSNISYLSPETVE